MSRVGYSRGLIRDRRRTMMNIPPFIYKRSRVHFVLKVKGDAGCLCWVRSDDGRQDASAVVERRGILFVIKERGGQRTFLAEPRKVFAIPIITGLVGIRGVVVP